MTHITAEIAFQRDAGKVYYFSGHLPVFVHDERDLATFRMFTSQLAINGNVTQAQISRTFGVPLVTVKRYVKLYRQVAYMRFSHRKSGVPATDSLPKCVSMRKRCLTRA